jgi:hypothetical protein
MDSNHATVVDYRLLGSRVQSREKSPIHSSELNLPGALMIINTVRCNRAQRYCIGFDCSFPGLVR